MSAAPALLYLHGLASSPKGRKREMLVKRLGPEGWKIVAPDLNVPSFRELSFAEMCAEAFVTCAEARPRVVIGSSLGALIALSLADMLGTSSPPLVLIAPALGFGERWKSKLPDGGDVDFFHHGEGRPLPIRRAFFEEMAGVHVDQAPPPAPVSVVMGARDESVPFEQVADAWAQWKASGRLVPGSRFHRVESGDHGLIEFGDEIEAAVRERLAG